MSRAVLLLAALATASSGCSLVYGIDRSRYRFDAGEPPPDTGTDGGIDSGEEDAGDGGFPEDVGTDATLDGWICPMRFERECTLGMDEDCDGFTDCEDSDCATALSCCTSRGALFPTETFTSFPSDWQWVPMAEAPIAQGDPFLHDFGNQGHPRAVRVDECLPIDLGVRISARILPLNEPLLCPAGMATCPNYAEVLVTESTDTTPPETLAENFAVRVYHDGRVEIRAAGEVLLDSADDGVRFGTGTGSSVIQTEIELSPGVQSDGLAYVFASVAMTQGAVTWPRTTGDPERFFEAVPIFPREYLRGAEIGCTGVPGLMLAFEGYGENVRVDDVGVQRFGCANPSHFERAGTDLVADDVDGAIGATDSDDWTKGGFGSPSIQSFFDTGGVTERTELFYDASNRDRTLELTDDVRYSIGGSYSTAAGGLTSYVPRRSGAPLLGLRPPDCLGGEIPMPGGCAARRTYRDPYLYVPVTDATRERASIFPLLYTRETAPLSGDFEIAGLTASISDSAVADGEALLAEMPVGCASMRDPVVIPTRPGNPLRDLVVLYTCLPATGPSSIRALAIPEWPLPTPDAVTELPGVVVSPGPPGTFSGDGVRAADAAVWFRGTDIVLRVWYVTEARTTDPATISFAEGTGPQGALPTIYPYPANPVLRSTDAVLGVCDAVGDCQIGSVAVTRLANQPDTVRLVIARTLESGTGIRHVLTPLDQVWPPLR